MKKVNFVIRIICAIMIILFGIGELFGMQNQEFSGQAKILMDAINDAEYFIFVIGIVKIIAGISLLTNRFVPFTLLLLAPVSLNLVLFHLFLSFDSSSLFAFIIFTINVYLLCMNTKVYRTLFDMSLRS